MTLPFHCLVHIANRNTRDDKTVMLTRVPHTQLGDEVIQRLGLSERERKRFIIINIIIIIVIIYYLHTRLLTAFRTANWVVWWRQSRVILCAHYYINNTAIIFINIIDIVLARTRKKYLCSIFFFFALPATPVVNRNTIILSLYATADANHSVRLCKHCHRRSWFRFFCCCYYYFNRDRPLLCAIVYWQHDSKWGGVQVAQGR